MNERKAVPEDEPVFILWARDRKALAAINFYLSQCDDDQERAEIYETIKAFEQWEANQGITIKRSRQGITT